MKTILMALVVLFQHFARALGFGSPWKELRYGFEGASSDLPAAAPFDGNPVLVRTNTGVVEAWWDEGQTYETLNGRESDGYCWICYDDAFQLELDDVRWWMPLPPLSAAAAEAQP